MTIKDEYEQKLQAQLRKIQLEVEKLKEEADKAKSDAKTEYYKQLEEVKQKQAVVEKKIHELAGASDEALKELKVGIEKSWKDLTDSVKSATEKFKQKP